MTGKLSKKPTRVLIDIIKKDRHDIGVLLVYTLIAGFLSLVIPIGAQALVNSLAAGVMVRPLVVLSLLVFIGLMLFGFFQVIQLIIVEKLQQRIFAKVSIQLSLHIPKIKLQELKKKYAPDMVNRFFDTMTLQKSFAKMLIHWPSAVLQIIIGLTIMWIYSIYLLVFSLFIIIFLFIIYKLGSGGIATSINESTEKYNVANWLEDLARCHFAFKMNAASTFINNKTDNLVLDYIKARRKHFKVIFRQYVSYYLFYALASTGILAIGGWLVIDHQLSLGQLVASELIIFNVLRSSETIMNFIDNYYDLIAGIEKIQSVLDLKTEKDEGELLQEEQIELRCKNLSFYYDEHKIIDNISFRIKPGQRVALIGKSGAGKTTLALLLSGALEPSSGNIFINNIDLTEYNLASLRSKIGIIGNTNEIFKGTVRENITIGNPNCSRQEIQKVVDLIKLNDDLDTFQNGIETELVNEGLNISLGQRLRILIARAMIKKPSFLILDEAFLSTDDETKSNIIDTLFDTNNKWTVLDISYDYDSVSKCDYIYALDNNIIVEQGTPQELFENNHSFVKKFFPDTRGDN